MKKLNSIKTLSIFEIFILVLGTIAIAYAIGGSVGGVEAEAPGSRTTDTQGEIRDVEQTSASGQELPAASSHGAPAAAAATVAGQEAIKKAGEKAGLEGLL